MNKTELKKYLPLIIALGIALIVSAYYFASGRSTMDSNIRELEKSQPVDHAETTANNSVVVHCKNGESYEIMYEPGQSNYQDLVYNKCGESGAMSETQQ